MLSIESLIDPEFRERTIWVPYLDTFEVELRYVSRPDMQAIVEAATERHWDPKTRAEIERPDAERIAQEFSLKAFGKTGWRGLTTGILAKILPVKVDDPTEGVPFSRENALFLLRKAYDFDTFIRSIVTDIERFQSERKETETKNSESSQSG